MRRLSTAIALLAACGAWGCDQLFPMQPDAARPADLGADAQPASRVSGQICVLSELRDYRLCSLTYPHGPLRVATDDGAAATTTGTDGVFALELPPGPALVNLRATDPRGQLYPGLVSLRRGGPATALPMVTVERMELLRVLGLPLAPQRGAVLAFVVDAQGNTVRNAQVEVQVMGTYQGPFFEDGQDSIGRGRQTGAGGLIGVFELPPGPVTLKLSIARENSYTLPVVAGTVTFSLLQ